MKRNISLILLTTLITLSIIVLCGPTKASAHCDGLDGPVVTAAKKALETGNVNLVLIWVQKKDEAETKKAFQKTLGPERDTSHIFDISTFL